ncbi:MAG: NADH-quinone oxidoreductase subunit J [Actinomycetota bacterium]
MNPGLIVFWILAAISVLTAVGVVLHRNPIRSALLLVLNFVCLAIFYVFLNAQVLAALQILVYAGAIMVLFLFVIQLLNLGGELNPTDPLVGQRLVGVILGAGLLSGLGAAIYFATKNPGPAMTPGASRVAAAEQAGISQIQIIGYDLFTRYVYPFELTSVLLLVGVIGVMILTKRRAAAGATDAGRS